MKERKIPRKNYIIYGIIVVVTLALVFYANEWYKAYKQHELENSYIASHVKEVNYLEFQNDMTYKHFLYHIQVKNQ